jgi:hypothetical protein
MAINYGWWGRQGLARFSPPSGNIRSDGSFIRRFERNFSIIVEALVDLTVLQRRKDQFNIEE